MRKSNFALRLQPSLLDEARKLAKKEGVALNQLINVAVAEKLSAINGLGKASLRFEPRPIASLGARWLACPGRMRIDRSGHRPTLAAFRGELRQGAERPQVLGRSR
jgi:hypothetical protein